MLTPDYSCESDRKVSPSRREKNGLDKTGYGYGIATPIDITDGLGQLRD